MRMKRKGVSHETSVVERVRRAKEGGVIARERERKVAR